MKPAAATVKIGRTEYGPGKELAVVKSTQSYFCQGSEKLRTIGEP